MNNNIKIWLTLILVVIALSGVGQAKKMDQEEIVVLPFENDTQQIDKNYGQIITSIIEGKLEELNYQVITRDLTPLFKEQNLSSTGIVDRAAKYGKIAGAKKVVSGRILYIDVQKQGESVASVGVNIKIVNVETAEVFKSIGVIEQTSKSNMSAQLAINQSFQKIGTEFTYELQGINPEKKGRAYLRFNPVVSSSDFIMSDLSSDINYIDYNQNRLETSMQGFELETGISYFFLKAGIYSSQSLEVYNGGLGLVLPELIQIGKLSLNPGVSANVALVNGTVGQTSKRLQYDEQLPKGTEVKMNAISQGVSPFLDMEFEFSRDYSFYAGGRYNLYSKTEVSKVNLGDAKVVEINDLNAEIDYNSYDLYSGIKYEF